MSIDVRIRMAWGADLTAASGTWTWTDVSTRLRGAVRLQYGAMDETSQTQPTAASWRMANEDGWLTPRHPLSGWYPNVRRYTPVEIAQDPTGTGNWTVRAVLFVDEFAPVWPEDNDTVAEVQITASDRTRQLGQGVPALRSAMYRRYIRTNPKAYWSLEDATGAQYAMNAIPGGAPMLPSSSTAANWAAAAGPPGSAPVASFHKDGVAGVLVGTVPATSGGITTAQWRMDVSIQSGPVGAGHFNAMLSWETPLSTPGAWELGVSQQADGGLYVKSSVGTSYTSGVAVDDGAWHHVSVRATATGPLPTLQVYLDNVLVINPSIIAGAVGIGSCPTKVTANPSGIANEEAPALGHIAVYESATLLLDPYDGFTGHAGERATDRVARLGGEENIPVTTSATTQSAQMGPQTVATLLSLWRECEAADGGILYGGLDNAGISYVAGQDLEDQAVSVALDTARGQLKRGFGPIEDDQRVRNSWTVARTGGGQATYTNTDHVADNGNLTLLDSTSVNVATDDQLIDAAAMRVALGTVEEMRVPAVTLELVDHPELWTAWLAMRPGKRITVANLLTQYPPGILDALVEGAVETIDSVSWRVDPLVTSPYAPYRTATFADDVGDTSEFVGRFEGDWHDLTLASSVTATATTLSVAFTTSPPASTTADDYPVLVTVDGEVMRVTAVSGTSSPQTYTVDRAVNGVRKTHAAGAFVAAYQFTTYSI